jgi:hypothetical protein
MDFLVSLLGVATATRPIDGQQLPADLTAGAAAAASNDQIRQLLDPHFPGDPWGIQEFTWWLTHQIPMPLRTNGRSCA